ncbi:MAG: YCF48-related protein, partial [Blastocatellia bacterium]
TWHRQQINPPAQDSTNPSRWDLKDVLFLNERLGWVVGDGVIYWTMDGGDAWQLASITSGGNRQVCTRVRFLDEQTGWITVRHSNEFLITTDGGKHWKLLKGPGPFLGPSADLIVLDRQHGFAVNRALYETKDGGKSWSTPPESKTERGKEYLQLERAVDGTLIAFGFDVNRMVALTSRDAGATWQSYNLQ